MQDNAARPSKVPFLIALFAAPALFGAGVGVFALMGDYGSRFAVAGGTALLLSLLPWFTAFAWLAWRDVKQGETSIGTLARTALFANCAQILIFPPLIWLMSRSEAFRSSMKIAEDSAEMGAAPSEALTLFLGTVAAFLVGIFVLPVLAAIFAWVGGKIKLGAPRG